MVDSNSDFRANWLTTRAGSALPAKKFKQGLKDSTLENTAMNSPEHQDNSPKNIQRPRGNWLGTLRKFKSPMYYWHTGREWTAVLSMLATGIVSILLFMVTMGGLSLFGILLALFADTAALAIVALVIAFLPSIAGIFGSQIVTLLVIPTVFSLLLSRGVTYVVARKLGHM